MIFLKHISKITVSALVLFSLTACTSSKNPTIHDTQNNSALFQAGLKAYAEEDCRKAISLFQQLAQSQDNPIFLNALGISYLQCKQYEQAKRTLGRAEQLSPQSAEVKVNYASSLFAGQEYKKAETKFKQALELNPKSAEAINGLASIYILNGRSDKAVQLLFEEVKNTDEQSILHYNYALALTKINLHQDAIPILEKFILAFPNHADAQNILAIAYQKNKQFDSSLSAIDKALHLHPVNAIYHFNKANILKDSRKLEDAKESYTKAITYDSEMAEAYINRGELYSILNQDKNACKDLETACELGFCERLTVYKENGKCMTGMWR